MIHDLARFLLRELLEQWGHWRTRPRCQESDAHV